jgi:hypothetical protein
MPMMVCMKCKLFFHPKKNGVYVEEGMPIGHGDEKVWHPYKIWASDLWNCRECGTEVIAGFSNRPIVEHYQKDYETIKAQLCPNVFVKDCM